MSAKVVGLYGNVEIASPGRPNPNVIHMLECVLERARAGETCGVVIVECCANNFVAHSRAGWLWKYPVVGALEEAKAHVMSCGGA